MLCHVQVSETVINVPPLSAICQQAVYGAVGPDSVCAALALVELLEPQMDGVAVGLVSFLARNLGETLASDAAGFQALPAPLLAELLGHPHLVCIFCPIPSLQTSDI